MMPTESEFIQNTRETLARFWDEALQTEWDRDRLVFAYPLMLPDGIQVVFNLKPVSATAAILSDSGQTLSGLSGQGVNFEATATARLLKERLQFFGIDRDGFELFKPIRLPIDPVAIQLFAEGLVSIAHLIYRHEVETEEENVARKSVERAFVARGLSPSRNHALEGGLEKSIRVSYYLEGTRGLALEVVDRKANLHGYMQQWGWRWTDLREKHPEIVRAMVYDPDRQDWDEIALEIGRSVCEVFCPYHENESLDEAIEMAEVK